MCFSALSTWLIWSLRKSYRYRRQREERRHERGWKRWEASGEWRSSALWCVKLLVCSYLFKKSGMTFNTHQKSASLSSPSLSFPRTQMKALSRRQTYINPGTDTGEHTKAHCQTWRTIRCEIRHTTAQREGEKGGWTNERWHNFRNLLLQVNILKPCLMTWWVNRDPKLIYHNTDLESDTECSFHSLFFCLL